jgi:hypothetical protein
MGVPGQPFPEDIEQRDRASEMAEEPQDLAIEVRVMPGTSRSPGDGGGSGPRCTLGEELAPLAALGAEDLLDSLDVGR